LGFGFVWDLVSWICDFNMRATSAAALLIFLRSTPTLTQSGLLAILLQYQRYKVFQLARRRARRKQVRAAFWITFAWPWHALTHEGWSTIPPSP
jgi:hypothetical protein